MIGADTLATALVASTPLAALALAVGLTLDRLTGDPAFRMPVWRLGLWLPILPLVLVTLNAILPEPIAAPVAILTFEPADPGGAGPIPQRPASVDLSVFVPAAILILAGTAASARALLFVWRAIKIMQLRRRARVAPDSLNAALSAACRHLGVTAPGLRLSDSLDEPLLTAIGWPMLILPARWAETEPPGFDAVLAHEAAHLKRRDHLWLWFEEAALCVMAANPLMTLIHNRLGAAREQACDALALAGRPVQQRRAFARAYLAALEARSTPIPALRFAGESRRLAMQRLTSILNPAKTASPSARLASAAGAALLLAAGTGTAWAATGGSDPTLSSELHSPQEIERMARTRMGDAAYEARQAQLRAADGAAFQRMCASEDAGDYGYCSGILIGTMLSEREQPQGAFCPPEPEPEAIDLARRRVAQQQPTATDTPRDVARAALADAYPCVTADERDPTPPRPSDLRVNGAPLPDMPTGYGPVQITGDEYVRYDDGTQEYRSQGGVPITRIAVNGQIQPQGFEIRSLDPTTIERIEVDSRLTYIDVRLEPQT